MMRLRQAREPVRSARRRPIAGDASTSAPGARSKTSSRAWRASPRSRRPRLTGIGCGRSRRSLGRVVFGQEEAVGTGGARDQAIARRPRPARAAGRLLPVHRPDRRRQDRARQAAGAAPRQRVHPLRHERVHGEARRRPADRRASRIRRLRAGRPAGRRRPHSIPTASCCSTRSRRRTPTSSTSCCR